MSTNQSRQNTGATLLAAFCKLSVVGLAKFRQLSRPNLCACA